MSVCYVCCRHTCTCVCGHAQTCVRAGVCACVCVFSGVRLFQSRWRSCVYTMKQKHCSRFMSVALTYFLINIIVLLSVEIFLFCVHAVGIHPLLIIRHRIRIHFCIITQCISPIASSIPLQPTNCKLLWVEQQLEKACRAGEANEQLQWM